jgi:hypothetical protein
LAARTRSSSLVRCAATGGVSKVDVTMTFHLLVREPAYRPRRW